MGSGDDAMMLSFRWATG